MTQDMPSSSPSIAIGGIAHETHTFIERQTTLTDFQNQALYQGDEMIQALCDTRSGLGGMIKGAKKNGWTLVPTVYAVAMPAGIVTADAYQTILDDLERRLKQALPLDGVLLVLHGAMVTEDHLDAESHILAQVRQIVGPEIPIVVELDMHGNVSPNMVELADVLVAFDTNPHVDPHARGLEASQIMHRILTEQLQPTSALEHVSVLLPPQDTGTADLPLHPVHKRASELEAEDEVICICVMGGFAYADTPFTGPSIIVTTNQDRHLAQIYAEELADILRQNIKKVQPEFISPTEAISQAAAHPGGPIILVDSTDNIGGGSPGDGTDALKAMIEKDVQEGTVVLADPEAVALCWASGEGTDVTLDIGGKSDNWHGDPIKVTGVVQTLSNGEFECELADNHFSSFYGNTLRMGRTAWLRVGGVNILLTERKTPPFDLVQLRGVGIIPEKQKMIVVKSALAYQAAYLPIATGIIDLDTSGLCSANLTRFPYKHVPRPIFPLDEIN